MKYAGLITCTKVSKDASGGITLEAEYCHDRAFKPLTNLHWLSGVPGDGPLAAEVRIYEDLFTVEEPGKEKKSKKVKKEERKNKNSKKEKVLKSFLDDINPCSEIKMLGALVGSDLKGHPAGTTFEFERLGYFVVDKDSTPGNLIFNRVCPLKDKRK